MQFPAVHTSDEQHRVPQRCFLINSHLIEHGIEREAVTFLPIHNKRYYLKFLKGIGNYRQLKGEEDATFPLVKYILCIYYYF